MSLPSGVDSSEEITPFLVRNGAKTAVDKNKMNYSNPCTIFHLCPLKIDSFCFQFFRLVRRKLLAGLLDREGALRGGKIERRDNSHK